MNPLPSKLDHVLSRVASFSTYADDAGVRPSAMAYAGLYYDRISAMVKCFLCLTVFENWKEGDDPLAKHKAANPNCPFVEQCEQENELGEKLYDSTECDPNLKDILKSPTLPFDDEFKQTLESMSERMSRPARVKLVSDRAETREIMEEKEKEYVPLREDDVNFATSSENNVYQSDCFPANTQSNQQFGTDASDCAVDNQHLKPKRPQFREESKRLASFNNYHERFQHAKSAPEYLAEAGFYYQGTGDSVRCFCCDGGLKDFEPDDDPWTEHARWFPSCNFVLERKDTSFIRTVQQKNGNAGTAGQNRNASSTTGPFPAIARRDANGLYHVDPREVKARMESPKVRLIIDMGYSRDIVKQAIENRLRTVGDDFDNAQGLLQSIFNMENAKAALDYNPAKAAANKKKSGHPAQSSVSAMGGSSYTQLTVDGQSHAAPVPPNNETSQAAGGSDVSDGISAESTQSSKKQKKKKRADAVAKIAAAANLVELSLDTETQELLQENNQLREARTCKVCLDKEVNTVFLPCGHLVCCDACSPVLKNCPVCRALIRGTVKVVLT